MNPCPQASDRLGPASHAGIGARKAPPGRFRDFTSRLRRWLPLAFLVPMPLLTGAQTNDAVSREISLFNFGQPTASYEAVSREVSVFDLGQPTASYEAVSREVSVFDLGQPTASYEAVSREVSVFDFGQPTARFEAVSREVSIFDFGQPAAGIEAISREVSVFERSSNLLDTISREVSVFDFGQPAVNVEGISREVSLYDYGYNQLNLAIGSTVVLAGTSGSVPVTFSTLAPVTNVQVAIIIPPNLLTNWSLLPQAPLTGTALVSNSSRLYLTFSPATGQSIINTQQLGQITFASISNQPSAFLPLPVASAMAPMLDGAMYTPYKAIENGEVVVLNSNSLLRAYLGTNGTEYVKLYGFSGTNYMIQSATNLVAPINWQTVCTLVPSSFIAVTPNLPTTNPAIFYRAKQ